MSSNDDNVRDVKINSSDNKKNQSIEHKIAQTAIVEYSDGLFSKYMCEFETLKKYFDINTSDFFGRFLKALIPFNGYFYSSIEMNPDLWGPVWINTFLVFLIAACGSITKYLNGNEVEDSFFQEFIPISAGVIYGIALVLPLVMFLLMRCFGSKSSFVTILCTYGYSMGIYIPMLIACSLPIGVRLNKINIYNLYINKFKFSLFNGY